MSTSAADQTVHSGSSVLICSRNRPDLLRDAVSSVLSMRTLPEELVVVDQSDEPHPELSADQPHAQVRLTYVWSRDRGLSRARNAGVAASSGELIGFLDDDVVADPDWLAVAVGRLRAAGPRHVVTGRVEPGPPEVPGAWAPSTISDRAARSYRGRLRKDVLYPHNMAMFRSALVEVGGFDERLGTGTAYASAEDNDFCYRLLRAGYVVDYCPDAVVLHRAWRREDLLDGLKYGYGRGQGAFYVKYVQRRDWFMLRRFASDAARHSARALLRASRGDTYRARADLAYTRGLLSGAAGWARKAP
ncbi:MAG TPA: glycosyltransferase [Nocardioidaceae bacterium]|nr:glycosyltransferase [Nocardioidaceae bacterium]